MPISDEALQNEKNRFIAVKAEATVGQTMAAIDALQGQPWWHVVVRMNDGSWRLARLSELVGSLANTAAAPEIGIGSLPQLKAAPALERASVETKTAQSLARKNSAGVLVITDAGIPVGILVERVMRGGAVDIKLTSANVEQLGGKYVKLKDYGSILLGSSKK